jgi:hypothetical protein
MKVRALKEKKMANKKELTTIEKVLAHRITLHLQPGSIAQRKIYPHAYDLVLCKGPIFCAVPFNTKDFDFNYVLDFAWRRFESDYKIGELEGLKP